MAVLGGTGLMGVEVIVLDISRLVALGAWQPVSLVRDAAEAWATWVSRGLGDGASHSAGR